MRRPSGACEQPGQADHAQARAGLRREPLPAAARLSPPAGPENDSRSARAGGVRVGDERPELERGQRGGRPGLGAGRRLDQARVQPQRRVQPADPEQVAHERVVDVEHLREQRAGRRGRIGQQLDQVAGDQRRVGGEVLAARRLGLDRRAQQVERQVDGRPPA